MAAASEVLDATLTRYLTAGITASTVRLTLGVLLTAPSESHVALRSFFPEAALFPEDALSESSQRRLQASASSSSCSSLRATVTPEDFAIVLGTTFPAAIALLDPAAYAGATLAATLSFACPNAVGLRLTVASEAAVPLDCPPSNASCVQDATASFAERVAGFGLQAIPYSPSPPPRPAELPPMSPPDAAVLDAIARRQAIERGVAAAVQATTAAVAVALIGSMGAAMVGAAAGGLGGAIGGLMPLLFGVQRLSMAGDLACNQGELVTGVAEGMDWSTGAFGLVRAENMAVATEVAEEALPQRRRVMWMQRRLRSRERHASNSTAHGSSNEAAANATGGGSGVPKQVTAFADALATFGIAMGVVLAAQLLGLLLWGYWCNRQYYRIVRAARKGEAGVGWRPVAGLAPAAVEITPAPGSSLAALGNAPATACENTSSVEQDAALAVQAVYHSKQGRTRFMQRRQELQEEAGFAEAAVTVQRLMRGRRLRRRYSQELAARRLQRAWLRRRWLRLVHNLVTPYRVPPASPPPSPPSPPRVLPSPDGYGRQRSPPGPGGYGRLPVAACSRPLPPSSPRELPPSSPGELAWAQLCRLLRCGGRQCRLQAFSTKVGPMPLHAEDAYETTEVEVEVEVPAFRPLPGTLVWPNLPFLAFWIFIGGLVKKATALLAYHFTRPDPAGEQPVGRAWLAAAVVVLLSVLCVMIIGLTMLNRFWRSYRNSHWAPTAVKVAHMEVADPCCRLWSRSKLWCDATLTKLMRGSQPVRMPSAAAIKEIFSRHDLNRDGAVSTSELQSAFEDLGLKRELALLVRPDVAREGRVGAFVRGRGWVGCSSTHTAPADVPGARGQGPPSPLKRSATRLDKRVSKVSSKLDAGSQLSEADFVALLRPIVAHAMTLAPMERIRGKWAPPKSDKAEPGRTKRLLTWPPRILHSHGSDYQDAMSMHLWAGASGDHWLGQCFPWASMAVQILVAVLSGVGGYLGSSRAAEAQVLTVCFIKLAWAALIVAYTPHMDKLKNFVIAAQFFSEGTSTVLAYIASQSGLTSQDVDLIQLGSFYLLLLPVFLPIVHQCYDAIFVNIVLNCCRKKFNPVTAWTTAVVLLVAMPNFFAKAFGFKEATSQFNAAKLTATSKALIAEAKKQQDSKGSTIRVTQVVHTKRATPPGVGGRACGGAGGDGCG